MSTKYARAPCKAFDSDVHKSHTTSWIAQHIARAIEVLPDNQGFDGTHLQALESVLDTVAVLASVLRNLVKEGRNELLLLHKLDIGKRIAGKLDGLVEAVLTTVRHIDNLDDLGQQTLVEHIGRRELLLKVGQTSKNQAADIGLQAIQPQTCQQLASCTNTTEQQRIQFVCVCAKHSYCMHTLSLEIKNCVASSATFRT
jgi:hypothetical protein